MFRIVFMFVFIEFKWIGMCGVFVIKVLFGVNRVYEKLSCFLMFMDMDVFCRVNFIFFVMFMNRLLNILSRMGLGVLCCFFFIKCLVFNFVFVFDVWWRNSGLLF